MQKNVFAIGFACVNCLSWGNPMMMWLLLVLSPYQLCFYWGQILPSAFFAVLGWDWYFLRQLTLCAYSSCRFPSPAFEYANQVHTTGFLFAAAAVYTAVGSAYPYFAVPSCSSISLTADWWSSGCLALSSRSFHSLTSRILCTSAPGRLTFRGATLVIRIFLDRGQTALGTAVETQSWSCGVSWFRRSWFWADYLLRLGFVFSWFCWVFLVISSPSAE